MKKMYPALICLLVMIALCGCREKNSTGYSATQTSAPTGNTAAASESATAPATTTASDNTATAAGDYSESTSPTIDNGNGPLESSPPASDTERRIGPFGKLQSGS